MKSIRYMFYIMLFTALLGAGLSAVILTGIAG